MKNQIKTIWHDPEYKSWNKIYDSVSHNVLAAVWAAAGRSVPAAAAEHRAAVGSTLPPACGPKIVLEYIFNWNITWWQNN